MAKEPGQVAYEAWTEDFDAGPFAEMSRVGKEAWAAVEAACRASALEDAAKVAERMTVKCGPGFARPSQEEIAAAIRALINTHDNEQTT